MATFEENILAYLDGSLDSKTSNEILHTVSVSQEKRALLDAHLRLTDILATTQKPVSAPLSVQRDLVSKIPVLAVKLPYLAEQPQRRDSVRGSFDRTSNRLPASSLWVSAVLVGCFVLVGVWFFANTTNNNNFRLSQQSPNIQSAQPQSSMPSQNIAPSSKDGLSNSAHSSFVSTSKIKESSQDHSRSSRNSSHGSSYAEGNTSVANSRANAPGNAGSLNSGNNAANNSSHAIGLADSTSIPSEANISSVIIGPLPIMPPEIDKTFSMAGLIISPNGEEPLPLHFFLMTQERNILIPNVPLTSYVTSNAIGITGRLLPTISPEFGIDYEIGSQFSTGIRGGFASFVQMQPFVFAGPVPGYPYLEQHTADVMLANKSAFWGGIAVSYIFNPEDEWHLGMSIIGGNAFLGNFSPIGAAELNSSYNLSSVITVRGAVSFDVSRIQPGAAPQPIPNNDATFGIVNQGPGVAPLTSSAFSISAGIVIHP